MSMVSPETGSNTRQLRLVALVFGLVVAALVAGYIWFLRADYAVLVQDIRPEEAAAIVEELKKEEVAFELRDGGTTILVPESQLNAVRLNVSSKELPLKGTVGFELFNESDMGLTDFAQKVNYQRALQGEITRTLLAMEGIAAARVHIALPERSLFRNSRSEPRAAVTVTPAAGAAIDADRVSGIQRLVAATIPDLEVERVAVLNERGQLLTPAYADIAQDSASELERAYAERARSAIANISPNLKLELKVATVARSIAAASVSGETSGASAPAVRDHSVRLILFTRSPLLATDEEAIRNAVYAELGLDVASGDAIEFSRATEVAAPFAQPASSRAAQADSPVDPETIVDRIVRNWLIAMALLGLIALGLWQVRARRLRYAQRDQLVMRIREQLRLEQGPHG